MKSELSPAALAAAIEESHTEFNLGMGRSPLVERHDSQGSHFVVDRLNYRIIKVAGDGMSTTVFDGEGTAWIHEAEGSFGGGCSPIR